MTDITHERKNNINTTEQLWDQVVQHHQLDCTKKDYTVNGFTTRFCYLTAKSLTARGVGKGRNLSEINISASYEAIEFYFSGYHFNPYHFIMGHQTEIANKYPLMLERCDVSRFTSGDNQLSTLPWVIFQDITTKENYAVPLAAVDLSYRAFLFTEDCFDYDSCNLYSASNGVASGASYEESVIHGALELIERDAYSYFLIDLFILNKSPYIIDKNTLSDDVNSLIKEIEKNYNSKIIIFELSSRFDVHVYHAVFQNTEFEIRPRGTGASLNKRYALERAIYELVQSYNLMHGSYVENHINQEKLQNNTLIKNFLEFDVKKIMRKKNKKYINFQDNTHEISSLSLVEYLDSIVERINRQGTALLTNTVYTDKNGLTCTRSIIPGAEEFFLATHYLKLMPKANMAEYINSQSGKTFTWDNYDGLINNN